MLAYSHIFVRLLTRLNDGQHSVLTTIAASGDAMRVIVASRDCICWETKLTESDLQKEKDNLGASALVSWNNFFDMFQKAFVERSIEFTPAKGAVVFSLRHDRSTDAFPATPFTATVTITVARQTGSDALSVTSIVQSLIEFMPMRLGERKEQDRIDEQARSADLLREDCDRIVEECDLLTGWRDRFSQEAANAEAEAAELAKLLDACQENDVAASWRAVVENTPSAQVLCPLGDPLSGVALPLPFNINFLRNLKSTSGFHVFVVPQPTSGGAPHLNSNNNNGNSDGPSTANTQHLRCCNAVPFDKKNAAKPPSTEEEDAVLNLLIGIDDWGNFDPLELEKACRRCQPVNEFGGLFYLGYYAFMKLGIAARFNISETTLLHFLAAVERGYDPSQAFHNSVHAIEVLYTIIFVLSHAELARKARLSDTQVLAMVMAALAVDINHAGVTNLAHVRSNSILNIIHTGQSVTESHHAAYALSLLGNHRYNILDCVSPAKAELIRATMCEFILSTDTSRGQSVLRFAQKQVLEGFDLTDSEQCGLLCCLAVMAADASFPAKPTHMYSRWVHGLITEQAALSSLEESLGLAKSSPTHSPDERAATHLRYINTVTQPIFAALSEVLPLLRMTGEFVAANKVLWGAGP